MENGIYEASCLLDEMTKRSKIVYLKTIPEVLDFTSYASNKILIMDEEGEIELELNKKNAGLVAGILKATVFEKDVLLAWNIKPLFSYLYFYLKKFINPNSLLIDLKIVESFMGISKRPPENLSEALYRSKIFSKEKKWKGIYQKIHLPLTLRVVPSIETTPLLDDKERVAKYPYYEIEGQVNGRMNCLNKFKRSYLPHTMSDEQKAHLKPRGYNLFFMYSDFNYCEVSVIQWLSKDDKLGEIIDSRRDVYEEIYRLVTRDDCDTSIKRGFAKLMFLGVIYGSGPNGLKNSIGVTLEAAKELIKRIKSIFSQAIYWADSKQEEAEKGYISDYFGRKREFPDGKYYLSRNSCVQGVAATFCLEKLIELHDELLKENTNICFSIHDGFGVIIDPKNVKRIYKLTKTILESESSLCPGLKLKADIKFGKKLNDMRTLRRTIANNST